MTLNEAWVALSLVRHIGNKTIERLLENFGSCEAILSASTDDLMQVKGIGQKIADAVVSIELDTVRRDIENWQNAGVHIIPQNSEKFPQILTTIPDPPLTLFVRGNYQPETWQNAVAIVGTRNPTTQSIELARKLATLYTESGWTVVSGLALGIDTQAHMGALNVEHGRTVAVLGGGVLNIYPPGNEPLANSILEHNGAILSENSPDASSSAPRLVRRNRIISGLCQRIIVVQSDVKGGAMHAANFASKQGREIFTVDWRFSGNQSLLKSGATPVNPDAPVIPSL